ncbi:MAG: alpha/beta fold hydrolase, partial [Cyanobacteria bacterium P01_F01_bin.42]
MSLVGMGGALATGLSAQAAETLSARYDQFEIDIAVTELESYATSNQQSPLLESLDVLLNDAQRTAIKNAISQKFEIALPFLDRFFATPSGDRLLRDLSVVIQADSKSVDTVAALKTAFIMAATQNDAVTLPGLLRAFPDVAVRVDLAQGIRLFNQLGARIESRSQAIASIKQRSQSSAPSSKALASQFSRPGPFNWDKQSFSITDERPVRLQSSRQPRTIPLDLYVPRGAEAAPVIVISHGLGSGRTSYQYFAEHLASHGYAVAVPEHSGSSFRHWQALLDEKENQISRPAEFVDRPLDIQYVLDVLTEKNDADSPMGTRLDLTQVGVFGHSYGGYTALALAGAKLSVQSLSQACSRNLFSNLNPSLLLQCQAAQLPVPTPELSDPRVKAVFVAHPILSATFGVQGLGDVQVPVAILAGGEDRVAPLVPEQIEPFNAISASTDRTLVVMERADHFSQIGEMADEETILPLAASPTDPVTLKSRAALKSLGLAFFQSRLTSTQDSRESLLTVVRSLNEPSFPVYGVA